MRLLIDESAARAAADRRMASLRARGEQPTGKSVFSYRHGCGATMFGAEIRCTGPRGEWTETVLHI